MPTIGDIEAAFVSAWPALETVTDGAWCARFGNGLTRRANAIQCNDPADDADADARLDALSALYDAHSLPPVFRVTPLAGRRALAALDAKGWAASDFALILDTPIGLTEGIDGDCTLAAPDDPEFLSAQAHLQGYSAAEAETFAAIIANLKVPAAGLTLYAPDQNPQASLLCVETQGIGVFLNVVTDPAIRRQGLGRRLMTSGLSWLAENGAVHAALQVRANNSAAIGLYLRLGFAYRYPYHYRQKQERAAP